MSRKHTRIAVALAATVLVGTSLVSAQTLLSWVREQGCGSNNQPTTVSCGNYGLIRFNTTQSQSSCSNKNGMDLEPVEVYPIPNGLTLPSQTPYSFADLVADGTSVDNLVAIDFGSAHGKSVRKLAANVAGPNVKAALLALDGSQFSFLGSQIGDSHVLAALCTVLDAVDHNQIRAPLAVNMSFGRNVVSATEVPQNCNPNHLYCQISRVIDRLKQKGSAVVAAAGNDRNLLFPAFLTNVMSIGMVDERVMRSWAMPPPAWETPLQSAAAIPGNGLCLDGTVPLPSGSSFSAAIYSGWFANLKRNRVGGMGDPLLERPWRVQRSTQNNCYALFASGTDYGCNPTVTAMTDGWAGANQTNCWMISGPPVTESVEVGVPTNPPDRPSISEFVAIYHTPTPGWDPCVPCEGVVSGAALQLNLSQSLAAPSGITLQSVSIHTSAGLTPLTLSATTLTQIQTHALTTLVINNGASIVAGGSGPSLVYTYHTGPGTTCITSPPNCYTGSTPILMSP